MRGSRASAETALTRTLPLAGHLHSVRSRWLPNRSVELRKWIAVQPDAVMHLHPCYIIDETGKRLGVWRCPLPATQSPVSSTVFIKRLLVQNFIAIPTPTIRRDAYLRVGGMDNLLWYAPDWDLYLKIAELGDIYYHPILLHLTEFTTALSLC